MYSLTDRKRIGFLNRQDMITREAEEEAIALRRLKPEQIIANKVSSDLALFTKINGKRISMPRSRTPKKKKSLKIFGNVKPY